MREQSFIYFMATADRSMVKIGCSIMPRARLEQIRRWSPVALELLAFVPGKPEDERAIHAVFLADHSHAEWFRASPSLSALILQFSAAGEVPERYRGYKGQPDPLHVRGNFKERSPEYRARLSHAARRKSVLTPDQQARGVA